MALDFVKTSARPTRNGGIEFYPKFRVRKSKDLMTKGNKFYAIFNEGNSLWSTDEQDVVDLVDAQTIAESKTQAMDGATSVALLEDYSTKLWTEWQRYSQSLTDNYHTLNQNIIFSNDEVKREDYASFKLDYPIMNGACPCWDELLHTLYDEDEAEKIEWAIGAVVNGDAKKIQKFLVFKGPPGSGKSSILNIIEDMFKPYCAAFDAKSLGNSAKDFALEPFKNGPLIAIQQDGDLSKIEDNTRLNSLISHEELVVNEKHKNMYTMKFNAFLFMGTNEDVMINSTNSGITRRLIDVYPSGRLIEFNRYNDINARIKFEYPQIAQHCLDVYNKLGRSYYNSYKPKKMIRATNEFFNYIEDNLDLFINNEFTTLKSAWMRYNQYVEEARVPYPMTRRKFKTELLGYFKDYKDQYEIGGETFSNCYIGFKREKFGMVSETEDTIEYSKESLGLRIGDSLLDTLYADCPAQYSTDKEVDGLERPKYSWAKCKTTLKDINTRKLHYVKVPNSNHVVVDFDLKDEYGNKSLERNIEAASKFPVTYTELSKSGCGVHLHYIYDGNVDDVSRIYDEGIEVKIFTGDSSLRRRLTYCNEQPVNHISSGLPLKDKGGKCDNMAIQDIMDLERFLTNFIKKCLNKEHHGATHPEVQFIYSKLEEAYASGKSYDVRRLYDAVMFFACGSTHHKEEDAKLVDKMKFCSQDIIDGDNKVEDIPVHSETEPIIFFDVEVFKNVFICCWKVDGINKVHRLINPTSAEIENLCKLKLVGFNNRKYDNHILWAWMLGYTNYQLYCLSKAIVANESGAMFSKAYNLSYTDIYDYSAKKQSLKKWEIELGISHVENQYDWDEPLPEDKWDEVTDYCCNDVRATEAVFHETAGDFLARQILAEVVDMTPNDTTNTLTQKLIFGNDKNPKLVYTDLATGEHTEEGNSLEWKYPNKFDGYEFVNGKNMYRGIDVGKGGLVLANWGMYGYTITFDVASMHPHSLIALNLFGEYTKTFEDLVNLRIAIKHGEFDTAKQMFNGKLAPYLDDPEKADALAYALKIAINSVYGLSSASFANRCRDPRNVNNIVALRGALFMKMLYDEVTTMGGTVVHIKTDSIKVHNPSPEICDYIMKRGAEYGYTFEIEHKFEKICLVNNAVYIAKVTEDDEDWLKACKKAEAKGEPEPTRWTATGTQFAVPYVFKTLFSREKVIFDDLKETKSVQTQMWLDFNENLKDDEHDMKFVGRIGEFVPIKDGYNGAQLLRKTTEGKYSAVVGTKGYRWKEAGVVTDVTIIDMSYYNKLVDDSVQTITDTMCLNNQSEFAVADDFINCDSSVGF